MKLASFSVSNYRSITTTPKIQTSNMTVLVGKNNEGKSNILRALVLAMDIMQLYSDNPRALNFSLRYLRGRYMWERDYPISRQERHPNGISSIDLIFQLSDQEAAEVRQLTGTHISNSVPVRVSLSENSAKIDIPKRGTAAFTNAENKRAVINYVCNKIDFNFIPAVRTENDTIKVIDTLISKELATLESDQNYISATETIERLQQLVLDSISTQILAPLQEFLPAVRDIIINLVKERRRAAMRSNAEVIIDDGTPTPIQQKGDGIKSLTALAMLNIPNETDRVSVIAIEEPESHLHPESAHQLFQTIATLAENHQVILTTHSPLFISRKCIKENVIVNGGRATPARRIKDIRDVLGTKVADNLITAEKVLLVEGEDDKIALQKLLPHMSDTISQALQNGTLIIDHLAGSGNLPYKLTFYCSIQCQYHVLLDNDEAGRQAGQSAVTQGLLTNREITYTICNDSPNAEMEDCYAKESYKDAILEEFGVSIAVREFRGNGKWSDRLKQCFLAQGKQWNDRIEKQVKFTVAEALPEDPDRALNPYKRSSIDALARALETMLSQ